MTSRDTMMNDKRTMHAAGPWQTLVVGDEIWIGVEHPEYGFVTHAAIRYGCDEAAELGDKNANARLIAAAPELLGELKRMYEHFSAFAADHSTEASTETWAALHCAKAAIAAAEVQS